MPKAVRVGLLFGLWVGGYLVAVLLQGWRIPALVQLAVVAGSFVGILRLDAALNDRYARRQFTRFPWVTGPHPPQHVRRKRTPPDSVEDGR